MENRIFTFLSLVASSVVFSLIVSFHSFADLVEIGSPAEGYQMVRAVFTPDVVVGVMNTGAYEYEELTDDEARVLAVSRGVALPELSEKDSYGRPWVIIKASIGMPTILSAHIEVFVHRNWTVGVGAGQGLAGSAYEGTIRWRPDAMCRGCDGENFFSIGFGIDPAIQENGKRTGVMVSGSFDLTYIHRFARHFGLMVGSSISAGLVKYFSADYTGRAEPVFKLNLIQVGFAF